VIGHVIFFGSALAVLVGLSLHFQNTTPVLLGSVVFILAHVAVASGLLYLGGRFLFRKFHAPPAARPHVHDNLKTLETEGNTIRWALFYDLLVKGILLGKEENLRASIVDLAQLQPGEKVLDVGCGTGSLAITAKVKAGASVEISGRDAAPEMIARARQKAAKAGVAIDFQAGVVEALDFPDDTFDVVLSSFMVHHLPGDLKAKAFAEIYRVLKPGGRLLVIDFEPPQNRFLVRILPLLLTQEMLKIDNSQIPPLLEGVGFMSVKTGNAGHRLASFVWGKKPS
jgi:demethylmenaquinone methyltransferase/2-methoxy-6-polyprenyl-1,4-benzoquinol methylase/phosphoethanolamine N-methyltransferase